MHFPIFLLISIFFVLLSNAVPAAVPKEANYFAKYQMPVKEMNAIDFESYVAKQKIYPVTMVKFYSPSCGHCVKMEPDYLKAAKQMLGVVPFISINCPDNNALCQKNNVKGYPTIKLMTIPGYLKGNYSKHWIDYESARVADAFIGAVQSHYPNNFISLKDKNLETLAERLDKNKTRPKALLFTKDSLNFEMKQLSVEFRGKMDFIYVYQPHETTMDLYGVKNLPALLAVEPDGLHEFYSGGFGANKKVLYKKLQEFCQGVIGIPAFTGVDLSGFKTLPGFMQKCLAKDSGISFVALMGDKLKLTEENRGKLNLLNYLSREIEKQSKPYRVCWMDENITLLPEFSQKFKIKDSWMLLVNGKKGRFLAWNGPKTEKALQSLLQDLSQGQLAWSKITEEKEEL